MDPTSRIIWAKMPGFPYWPARYCEHFEETELERQRPKPVKGSQVAVSFLGLRCERGWIPDNLIVPFTIESLGIVANTPKPKKDVGFTEKKFKSDKDFRAAVVEGIRILNYSGLILPLEIKDMVKRQEPDIDWDRPDACTTCGGTIHSGAIFICAGCSSAERHTHCLHPYPYMSNTHPPVPLLLPPTAGWLCESCCKARRLPLDSMVGIPDPSTTDAAHPTISSCSTSKRPPGGNSSNSNISRYDGKAEVDDDGQSDHDDCDDDASDDLFAEDLIYAEDGYQGEEGNKRRRTGDGGQHQQQKRPRGRPPLSSSVSSSSLTSTTVAENRSSVGAAAGSNRASAATTTATSTSAAASRPRPKPLPKSLPKSSSAAAHSGTSSSSINFGSLDMSQTRRIGAAGIKHAEADAILSDLAEIQKQQYHSSSGTSGTSNGGGNNSRRLSNYNSDYHGGDSDNRSPPAKRGGGSVRRQHPGAVPCGKEEEEEEVCQVCREGGTVLMCDFPGCRRVYHHACVLTTCPVPLGEEEEQGSGGGSGSSGSDYEQTWFCPCHQCAGCDALQSNAEGAGITASSEYTSSSSSGKQRSEATGAVLSLAALNPPAILPLLPPFRISTNSSNNNSSSNDASTDYSSSSEVSDGCLGYAHQLPRKPLRACTTCAFAICKECESTLGDGKTLLRTHTHRIGGLRTYVLTCLNCSSNDPRVRLAKLLEAAWSRACSTRLATPFMRPLLPLLPLDDGDDDDDIHRGRRGKQDGDEAEDATGKVAMDIAGDDTAIATTAAATGDGNDQNGMKIAALEKVDIKTTTITTTIAATENEELSSSPVTSTGTVNTAATITDDTITPSGSSSSNNSSSSSSSSSSTNNTLTTTSTAADCGDLLSILEKIRSLRYSKASDMLADFASIRSEVARRLNDLLLRSHKNGQEQRQRHLELSSVAAAFSTVSSSDVDEKPLLSSFDTLIDACEGYLKKTEARVTAITLAEEAICASHLKDGVGRGTSTGKDSGAGRSKSFAVSSGRSGKEAEGEEKEENEEGQGRGAHGPSAAGLTVDDIMMRIWRRECCRTFRKPSSLSSSQPSTTAATSATAATTASATSATTTAAASVSSKHPPKQGDQEDHSNSSNSSSSSSSTYSVLPRSLLAWNAFVNQGAMPDIGHYRHYLDEARQQQGGRSKEDALLSRGRRDTPLFSEDDPWGLGRHSRGPLDTDPSYDSSARAVVGHWLKHEERLRGTATELRRRDEALSVYEDAGALRETVTLLEQIGGRDTLGAPATNPWNQHADSLRRLLGGDDDKEDGDDENYFRDDDKATWEAFDGGSVAEDETLVVLNRMRDLTTRTLQLQAQLRRQHTEQRRRLLSGEAQTGTVRIGDASLVRELKLANDTLQWRLQQRQRALNASNEVISSLRSNILDAQVTARRAEDERDEALREAAKTKAELRKLQKKLGGVIVEVEVHNEKDDSNNSSSNSSSNSGVSSSDDNTPLSPPMAAAARSTDGHTSSPQHIQQHSVVGPEQADSTTTVTTTAYIATPTAGTPTATTIGTTAAADTTDTTATTNSTEVDDASANSNVVVASAAAVSESSSSSSVVRKRGRPPSSPPEAGAQR